MARPQMTFGGEDLYPEPTDKAASLMHALVMNRPFADGDKRVGAHAAVLFLLVNVLPISGPPATRRPPEDAKPQPR